MRARGVPWNTDAEAVAAMCAADDKRQPQLRSVPASSAKDDHAAPARGNGLLRNDADWRCILWIVKYFALSALAWYYDDAIFASVPLSMVTFVVLSYYSFAGATVVHNTMHCRCFNNSLNAISAKRSSRAITLDYDWFHLLSLPFTYSQTYPQIHYIGFIFVIPTQYVVAYLTKRIKLMY